MIQFFDSFDLKLRHRNEQFNTIASTQDLYSAI